MKVFKTIRKWHAGRRAYVNTVRELSALSNRELNDLGIARVDIPSLARQHVDGVAF